MQILLPSSKCEANLNVVVPLLVCFIFLGFSLSSIKLNCKCPFLGGNSDDLGLDYVGNIVPFIPKGYLPISYC